MKLLLKNLTFALAMLGPRLALAAGEDEWIKPATGLLENLESGLVTFGVPAVGIGIIIAGLLGALMMNLDPRKLGILLFSGALITVGPSVIKGLLALAS